MGVVLAGGAAAGAVLASSSGPGHAGPPRRVPPAALVVLSGSGVGGVRFGISQASAIGQLDRLLGPPRGPGPRLDEPNCGIDVAVQWRSLTAYFFRGRFVGYSTLGATGEQLAGTGGEATEKGLKVGESLAEARRLYGSALTTSLAQGGVWFARTPTGAVEGYLTAEPNQTSAPVDIASIEAGSLGCPAASP